MSLKINDVAPHFEATDFEEVRTHLLDLVQGTTACSSTVFYGLLAWVSLNGQTPSQAEITTVTGRQGIDPFMTAPTN